MPGLDFEVLADFTEREDQPAAIRELRDWVRAQPTKRAAECKG